jgi:hypothetical protein
MSPSKHRASALWVIGATGYQLQQFPLLTGK